MRKFLIFLTVFGLCLGMTVNAKTVSSECDISDINQPIEASSENAVVGQRLDIKAKSAILMEVRTGRILYEDNIDQKLAPASITKIMSLLLVMEALERGDLQLETVVNASEHACSMGGSQIWLEPGEGMTVDDLLKATVIASANDACVALGEAIAGSEEGFVALMNQRAKQLGMNNTHFVNATGLDAEGHLTSAHDVAVMSAQLIKHELIKKYSTVWMDSLRDGKSELVNTNKLVRFYEGTTGLKTGTTGIAKYCLSATAKRNGMELVAVVLAGETSNDRFAAAKKLLDYGFANYSFQNITADLKDGTQVTVQKGVKKKVSVTSDGSVDVLSAKTDKQDIKRKTEWNQNITAPIRSGDLLGYVNVYTGDTQVGRIKITAAENVERLNLWVTLKSILNGLLSL